MRVLVAGGGTGGHLFPGIALAEEVVTRHPKNDAVFVGTNRGLEARVVPQHGFAFESIPSRGLKGMSPAKLLLGLATLPVSLAKSVALVHKYRPDVVVGVGGYASGPVVVAAWLMRVPTAVQEQNAVPGLTNRLLSRLVDAVFVSFDEAREGFSKPKSVHLLGNPIRKTLMENFLRPRPTQKRGFHLLVFGGSLGARGLNAKVIEALAHLGPLKDRLTVLHQTGKADVETVRHGYSQAGVQAEVVEFIEDMSDAYAKADVVLCRAGATTIAELTVCKKASILVPFPHATDDHQAVNAKALVEAGAAMMFRESELNGEKLAQALIGLADNPAAREKMEKAAGNLGHPEAAREITEMLVAMAKARWGDAGRSRGGPSLRPTEGKKP
jgi:UDP-N-acetylglucosamine--N-acetylmuramyl-(pentapeptide) pyrophosphoryl-undecaprenol N-acetylglucosamine transferase